MYRSNDYVPPAAFPPSLSLSNEYGNWLDSYPWQVFGSLTFRFDNVTLERAKASYKVYIRRIEQRLKCSVAHFGVLEYRKAYGDNHEIAPHFHCLLAAPDHMSGNLLVASSEIWRKNYGNQEIRSYVPGGGAASYLCKTAGNDQFHVESDMTRLAARIDLSSDSSIFTL